MSNLADQIESLKTNRGVTALDISRRSGVNIAIMSRVKNRGTMTFDELRKLCRVFPEEAPALLLARLQDEISDFPGSDSIEMKISGAPTQARTDKVLPPLPALVGEAIWKIISCVGGDTKLRNMILWIGARLPSSGNEGRSNPHKEISRKAAELLLGAGGVPVKPSPPKPRSYHKAPRSERT
jgi:hypothetical protein